MADWMSKQEHASANAHRLGHDIPLSNEPVPCVPGVTNVGGGEGPAAGNHTHSVNMILSDGPPSELNAVVDGIFYYDIGTSQLMVRVAGEWTPVGGGSPGGTGIMLGRFSRPGEVVISDPSEPLWFQADGTLTFGKGVLSEAGSSTTQVEVYLGGGSIGTFIWGSGVTLDTMTVSEPITARSSELTVEVTSAGTGAAGISLGFEVTPA